MNERKNVLVVEDESAIPRALRHPLSLAGFEMDTAETVGEALKALAQRQPDLVLLDLGLRDGDGKSVIAAVRQWSDVPIIVISARDDEAEKIAALDLGADDYVNKPFGIGELLARMRAALRHRSHRRAGQSVIRIGDLSLDLATRRVRMRSAVVHLAPKEYDVLRVLAQHCGQVVTHKQLLDGAWGASQGRDYQHVRVVVGQIRKKLELAGPSAPAIVTEQGVGYRMQAGDEVR